MDTCLIGSTPAGCASPVGSTPAGALPARTPGSSSAPRQRRSPCGTETKDKRCGRARGEHGAQAERTRRECVNGGEPDGTGRWAGSAREEDKRAAGRSTRRHQRARRSRKRPCGRPPPPRRAGGAGAAIQPRGPAGGGRQVQAAGRCRSCAWRGRGAARLLAGRDATSAPACGPDTGWTAGFPSARGRAAGRRAAARLASGGGRPGTRGAAVGEAADVQEAATAAAGAGVGARLPSGDRAAPVAAAASATPPAWTGARPRRGAPRAARGGSGGSPRSREPPPPTRLGGAPDRVHDAGRPAARARRVWPAAAAGAPAASGAAPPGQPRSPPPSRGCRAHAHPLQRAGPVRFGCAARVRCVVRSHAPPAHAAHACPPGVGTPLAGRWPVGSGRRGRRGGSRHRPQAGGWDHTRAARRRRQRHAPPADPPPRQHADSGGQGGRRHKPVASDAATAPIPRSPPCTRCTASGGRERRG